MVRDGERHQLSRQNRKALQRVMKPTGVWSSLFNSMAMCSRHSAVLTALHTQD